jgi:hypothetical protein
MKFNLVATFGKTKRVKRGNGHLFILDGVNHIKSYVVLGSRAARKPSPKRLKNNTVKKIAIPG